ncbi:hypothetical protein [Flocculibacter collagenilyticus]|uniref:hypothetical protein n=1 Tax=Flocculibacter collagenilyticus TaxID=2744479 RepID=UPI0018F6B7DB|nr:hypothetical protein [Flocculibacter collagenilyticus]
MEYDELLQRNADRGLCYRYMPENPIPKKTRFNRFFQIQPLFHDFFKREQINAGSNGINISNFILAKSSFKNRYMEWAALKNTARFLVIDHEDVKDIARLKVFATIGDLLFLLLHFVGGIGTIMWVSLLLMSLGDSEQLLQSFIIFLVTISWNFCWINVHTWYQVLKKPNCMYFDRKNQTVSMHGLTKYIDKYERYSDVTCDEFGNVCFKWEDVVCTYSKVTFHRRRANSVTETYIPTIRHKSFGEFPEFSLRYYSEFYSSTGTFCALFWERIIRFMDISKPLPESPEFEVYRHTCPVTAEHDILNNRPLNYWHRISRKSQAAMEKIIANELYIFDFSKKNVQTEIDKPWIDIPVEKAASDKPTGYQSSKLILRQLTLGY